QQAKMKAFGDKPGNAPIVHFDGPQTFALFDSSDQVFARGKDASYLAVVIGTKGADQSTFTTIPCEAVPAEVHPVAEIEFPGKGADAKPIKNKFILDHRC
ncbi:MAG TPA: hypothetical protein VGY77_00050, partial [Gemmataceae bacterium]|nr:hypothetical protein [Gemmataceae bacterium]